MLAAALTNLSTFTALGLSCMRLHNIAAQELCQPLGHLTCLTRLDLQCDFFCDDVKGVLNTLLPAIGRLSHLEELSVQEGYTMGEAEGALEALAPCLSNLTNLRKLTFSGSLGKGDVWALEEALAALPDLRHVVLLSERTPDCFVESLVRLLERNTAIEFLDAFVNHPMLEDPADADVLALIFTDGSDNVPADNKGLKVADIPSCVKHIWRYEIRD